MWLSSWRRKPPTAISKENDKHLQKFANDRSVVLLLFVSAFVPIKRGSMEGTRSEICSLDEYNIDKILNQIDDKYRRNGRKAYLVVSSPGGNVDSSFRIAVAVRRFFDDITMFVPRNAHSGGTLLALIGNRIRMGRMGSLSPLDVQTEYNGKLVSANYIISAKTNLDECLQKSRSGKISLIDKKWIEFFDPITLEQARKTQEMGMSYVRQILAMAKYTDPTAIASEMCTGFPNHNYVINAHQAKTIGIAIEDANVDKQAWDFMYNWFLKYDTKPNNIHYVRYIIPE